MLTTLSYFLAFLHCGLGVSRLERLVTLEAEAGGHMSQCLEDGDFCWGPEECCTGAGYEYHYLGADITIKESAVTTGLRPPPLCSGSAALCLSAR